MIIKHKPPLIHLTMYENGYFHATLWTVTLLVLFVAAVAFIPSQDYAGNILAWWISVGIVVLWQAVMWFYRRFGYYRLGINQREALDLYWSLDKKTRKELPNLEKVIEENGNPEAYWMIHRLKKIAENRAQINSINIARDERLREAKEVLQREADLSEQEVREQIG